MPRDLIGRYIWIVDTLNRYGRLTRRELNDLWLRSSKGDGNPIPERTFYHHRRAIEENFHIDIKCDSSGAYYIDSEDDDNKALTNWLLDSYALSSAMKESHNASDRVEVEDVPSARQWLPTVLEAVGNRLKIKFTYAGFSRSRAEADIILRPYLLKRYKQRWYVIGLKESADDIRTYALDRIKELTIVNDPFTMPDTAGTTELFSNIIGITVSKAPIRTVKIRTTSTQAKYFRALPFHHSQQEEIHDFYSVFTYRLKINFELVHELLGLGDAVVVLEPKELRIMMINELKSSLSNYKEL